MKDQTHCPQCQSPNIYNDGNLWICPECSHEWNENDLKSKLTGGDSGDGEPNRGEKICDAFGNELKDGDSVTVVKELKIKGASSVIKVGTKVKNIKLSDQGDGHDIACKIDGIGSIHLKSEFVKKA